MSNTSLGCYLSDDGRTVVVLEGDREEQFTVDEFVMIYGEDALPVGKRDGDKIVITDEEIEARARAEEEAAKRKESINQYYDTMLDFLNAIGYHQGFLKLVSRYDNPDSDLEKTRVRSVIEEDVGVPIQFIDQELHRKDRARRNLFFKLNQLATGLGLPESKSEITDVLSFLSEQPRRESIRNRIRTLRFKDEPVSLDALIEKRKKWEKISAEKRGEKYGS